MTYLCRLHLLNICQKCCSAYTAAILIDSRVKGSVFRVKGSGCRVKGVEFSVLRLRV